MQHKIFMGKPKGKEFEDVREIPSNEAFNYLRRGFETLDADQVEKLKLKPADQKKPADKSGSDGHVERARIQESKKAGDPKKKKRGKKK